MGQVRFEPLTVRCAQALSKRCMALSCELTAVGTLQWSDTEAGYTLPWLGLDQTHKYYQNDGGYQPEELTTIHNWYSMQHAYLIEQMAKVEVYGGSMLDQSVVFFGSQHQNPATHSKVDMPFMLAGSGGGLRTNRWLTFDHPSHNDLLVSIFNLFGDRRTRFGDFQYCSGPLAGLT